MRKYNVLKLLLLISVIIACKSQVTKEKNTTPSERFMIIIGNYYRKNKSDIKKYDVFRVDERSPKGKNYYLYNVLPKGEGNFYVMRQKDAYLPSDYVKYEGKIFLLHEQEVNNVRNHSYHEVLRCLDSLNMLDSTDVKLELKLLRLEEAVFRKTRFGSRKGVDYVICKENPFKIKKSIKGSVHIDPNDERFENVCD
ncbi:hypothetical protein GWA97_00175 [Flavobacterium sp. LaA7.5]|nr:hypothetical protein [Flavobacterium salilacus subsp. altitudinum]